MNANTIHIENAVYGDNAYFESFPLVPSAVWNTVTGEVGGVCSGQQSCSLRVNNENFGIQGSGDDAALIGGRSDPRRGFYKQLRVRYRCMSDTAAGAVAAIASVAHEELIVNEGNVMQIQCASLGAKNDNDTRPYLIKEGMMKSTLLGISFVLSTALTFERVIRGYSS